MGEVGKWFMDCGLDDGWCSMSCALVMASRLSCTSPPLSIQSASPYRVRGWNGWFIMRDGWWDGWNWVEMGELGQGGK